MTRDCDAPMSIVLRGDKPVQTTEETISERIFKLVRTAVRNLTKPRHTCNNYESDMDIGFILD